MELNAAVNALTGLAQGTRLSTFRLLVQTGPDGLVAGTIATQLGVPATTLSFHLSQLRGAGLISVERCGREMRYRANYTAIETLVAYLTENCCGTGTSASLPDSPCDVACEV